MILVFNSTTETRTLILSNSFKNTNKISKIEFQWRRFTVGSCRELKYMLNSLGYFSILQKDISYAEVALLSSL